MSLSPRLQIVQPSLPISVINEDKYLPKSFRGYPECTDRPVAIINTMPNAKKRLPTLIGTNFDDTISVGKGTY